MYDSAPFFLSLAMSKNPGSGWVFFRVIGFGSNFFFLVLVKCNVILKMEVNCVFR